MSDVSTLRSDGPRGRMPDGCPRSAVWVYGRDLALSGRRWVAAPVAGAMSSNTPGPPTSDNRPASDLDAPSEGARSALIG